jgi:N-acetylmuramoyl-L-alanine amidase
MRRPRSLLRVAIFLLLAAGRSGGKEPEFVRTVVVSSELKVAIARGDVLYLFAKPLPGEGIKAFAKRFSDNPATEKKILEINRKSNVLLAGVYVRVPYDLLSDNYKKIALQAIFPDDTAAPSGWSHRVTAPSGSPESLWRIAEWFTGNGANYQRIRKENAHASLQTEAGETIRIPVDLLLPPFRASAVARDEEGPAPLTFGKDAKGDYASYRLRKGEALYSSVVVRFTGLVHAEDVNAEAERVARRSGVEDVHSIPVGFEIKIPREDLLPEYKPASDPQRVEYERSRLETAQFVNRIRAVDLAGITVVLDPGHGGRDTGALIEGVAEARYVYDISKRVADILKRQTRAKVVLTVDDARVPGVSDSDRLTISTGGRVMTSPPYPIDDAIPGVHLRWYLANSLLKAALTQGGEPTRVVFISIHADSLHSSVRGAMVYIPGEKYLTGSFSKSGSVYQARREYRQEPRVSFSRRERLEADGVSRELAEKIIGAFRRESLPIHPYNPIREYVIRGGREWVPAVIRYNRIPTRLLLEVCNLNNNEDRALIQTRDYRAKVARGVIEALTQFYESPAGEAHAGGRGSSFFSDRNSSQTALPAKPR